MKVTITYEADIPDEDEIYEMLVNFNSFIPFENEKTVLYAIDDNIHTIQLQDLVKAHAVCRENLQKLESTKVKSEYSKDKKATLHQLETICNELCFAINKDTGGPWG